MKAIQRELGERDEGSVEAEEFRKKIETLNLPEEASKEAARELDRLAKLPAHPPSTESSALISIGSRHCRGTRRPPTTWILLTLAQCWMKIIMD